MLPQSRTASKTCVISSAVISTRFSILDASKHLNQLQHAGDAPGDADNIQVVDNDLQDAADDDLQVAAGDDPQVAVGEGHQVGGPQEVYISAITDD